MALVESNQSGSLTTTSASNDITISAVVIAQSYVIVTLKTEQSDRNGFQKIQELTTTTNLNVSFSAAPASDVTIEWQVIEFTASSGIVVQAGRNAAAGGSSNVTISAVTLADSHVDIEGHEGGSGTVWNGGKTTTAHLSTTTNINLSNGLGSNSWQVCDWNGHANVEYVEINLGTSDTGTIDTTIGTLTDYTKTAVFGNSREGGDDVSANTDFGAEDLPEEYCTSNTNVRLVRQGGSQVLEHRCHVVEFTDSDIDVQQFNSTIASSGTSTTATLNAVVTANTIIAPGAAVDNTSGSDASKPSLANVADYCAVRYVLTNTTTVTMDRIGSGAQVSKMSFSTIEFDVVVGGVANPYYAYAQQ